LGGCVRNQFYSYPATARTADINPATSANKHRSDRGKTHLRITDSDYQTPRLIPAQSLFLDTDIEILNILFRHTHTYEGVTDEVVEF
jgi:hypothetical protein